MHPEEKDIYKFVIIVAAVLSIIIAYFIISIIRQQRRTLKLNQEKIQAEEGINTYEFIDKYNLKKGIYYVTLLYNDQRITQKIIKN